MTNKILPDWQIVKLSERSFWNEQNQQAKEILDQTTAIYGVWAFDRNLHVHICSLTPTYEIWWLDSVYDEVEGLTDEQREDLNNRFMDCCGTDNVVDYINVSDMDRIMKANPERVQAVTLTEEIEEEKERDLPEEILEGWATGALMF